MTKNETSTSNLKDIIELFDENILEDSADFQKAEKVFIKVNKLLEEAGFKKGKENPISNVIDVTWKQAESEYNYLL